MPEDRTQYVVGVIKIPYEQRDVAHAVEGGLESRAFFDVIGAADDPAVPLGAEVVYRVELTDAEAREFAQASNARYVTPDVFVPPSAVTVPSVVTLAAMRAVFHGGDAWHGRDVPVAILDGGTTAAVRAAMGWTLVARTVLSVTPPPSGEINGVHGCWVASDGVPAGGRILDVVIAEPPASGSNVGGTFTSTVAAGLRWAADRGARIANVSFGADGALEQVLVDGGKYFTDRGGVITIAMGNANAYRFDNFAKLALQNQHVHSVIALDENPDARAGFSNYHQDATGSSPGANIRGLSPSGVVELWSGTSGAAPHVAHLIARGSTGGRFTPQQVAAALKTTCRDTLQEAKYQGAGAYDLYGALRHLGGVAAAVQGGASPQFLASAQVCGLSSTFTYNRSPSLEPGDLEILTFTIGKDAATVVPSGWVELRNQADAKQRIWVVARNSKSTDPTQTTFTFHASNTYFFAYTRFYVRSPDGVITPDRVAISTTIASGKFLYPIPSVPTRINDHLFSVFASKQSPSGSSLTLPSGHTQRNFTRYSGGTGGYTALLSSRQLDTSDSPNTYQSTANAEADWTAIQLSVSPPDQEAPVAVPADVINLDRWYITLPVADPTGQDTSGPWDVYQPALATFSNSSYFYVESGKVVFRAPAQGVTTSSASGATRSELREMTGPTGPDAKASWGFDDGKQHTLTFTGTADPTSVVGRKECIVGQIHDAGGTPPIYLAINMNSLPGRLAIFKNGPSDGDLLTGLTPTTEFSYRIDVDPNSKTVKVYAGLGGAANLALKKTYPIADFASQTSGCYFKAGAYNKEPISTATTGASIVRASVLTLTSGTSGGTPTPAPTLAKPAPLVHIGPDPSSTIGWNHANLGHTNGGPHFDTSQADLATYQDPPWYFSTTDADGDPVVQMSAPIGGGATSNSGNPRTEYREMQRDGTTRATWNPQQGDNWIEGIYRFVGLAPAKPECSAVQAHNADDDTIMVLTKKRSDGGQDLILKAMFPGQSNSAQVAVLKSNYVIGTKFYCKLRVHDGGDLSVYFTTDTANIPTTPVYFKDNAFAGGDTGGWYFKWGAYVQANPTSDPTDSPTASLTKLQLQKIKVFHSGYPTPAPYAASTPTPTPGPDPTPAPTPTPAPNPDPGFGRAFLDGVAIPTIPAATTVVNATPSDLASRLAAATPGQKILCAAGTYSGNFTLAGKAGTSSAPITITCATALGIKFAAGSSFTINNSSYVTFSQWEAPFDPTGGAFFQVRGTSHHVKVEDWRIGPPTKAASAPADTTGNYLYVGDDAEFIELGYFELRNKTVPGVASKIQGNFDTGGGLGGVKHIYVHDYYVHDIGPEQTNEFEPQQHGLSSMSKTASNSLYEYGRYERCLSEPEVFSGKMGRLELRAATFLNCVGGPVLRHGDNSKFHDLYIIGTATGALGTKSGGIRGYGANHEVYRCYIANNGEKFQAALLLDTGDADAGGTDLTKHFRVEGWNVHHNVLVNTLTPICIGDNYDRNPRNVAITDNIVAGATQGTSTDAVMNVGAASLEGTNTLARNTRSATPAAAGLVQDANGVWRKSGFGPIAPFLAASAVGPNAPRRDVNSPPVPDPVPDPGPNPDPTPDPSPDPTPDPTPGPSPTPTPTPPAPTGAAYSPVTPWFAGSQLTSPELRYSLAAAFARSSSTSLGPETGVLPGGGNSAFFPTALEAGSTPRVSVAAGQCVIARASGTYVCTLPAAAAVQLPNPLPPSGQTRIDLLVGDVVDPEADSGVTTGTLFRVRVVAGTAASVPAAPPVPTGAIPLWQWRTDNGGSVSAVTSRRLWTRAPGGIRLTAAGDDRPGAGPGDVRIHPTGQMDAWVSGAWIPLIAPAAWTEVDIPWTYGGTADGATTGEAGTVNFGTGSSSKCRYKRVGNDLQATWTARYGTGYNTGSGSLSTVLPAGMVSAARDQFVPCHLWVNDAENSGTSTDWAGSAFIPASSRQVRPYFPLSDDHARLFPHLVALTPGVKGQSRPTINNGYAGGGRLFISGLVEVAS